LFKLNKYGNEENLTKNDYRKYMKVVNRFIKETERNIETLEAAKIMSKLTFEDWVLFQK